MRLRVSFTGGTFDWETSERLFRLGRADGCALRFDGDASKGVSWEHALVELQSDGRATVTDLNSSNGTYVDGSRIEAAAPIRLGSLIQLGRTGPRIEVLEIAGPARPMALAPAASAPASNASSASRTKSQPTMASWTRGVVALVLLAAVGTVVGYLVSRQMLAEDRASDGKPAIAGTPPSSKATEPTGSLAVGGHPPSGLGASSSSAATPPSMAENSSAPASETTDSRLSLALDPWEKLLQQIRPGIQLVVVEDPKTHAAWPFATIAKIGAQEFLTTAGIVSELAKFKARGWTVTVRHNPQQPGIDVSDIRIHAAYEQAKPEEQLYFDMGLLTTDSSPAAGGDLVIPSAAEIEVGQKLACVTVDHEGEPIDRFQRLEPRAVEGKIFAITGLPPQPGGPRLLHLRGSFSDKAGGSPIIDEQGKLIALYCEPAPSAGPGKKDLHIHYAMVIEPDLIALAADSSNQIWVHPKAVLPTVEKPSP